MDKNGLVIETLTQAREAFDCGEISIPFQVIPSYVLERDRQNFVYTSEEFDEIVQRALDKSPIGQVLIVKFD